MEKQIDSFLPENLWSVGVIPGSTGFLSRVLPKFDPACVGKHIVENWMMGNSCTCSTFAI